MRIQDVYTICKQTDIRVIPTLIRHLHWRVTRHANVLMSPRVYWSGHGKTNICGRLMIGFDNSILSHSNSPTTIKMCGRLMVNGISRIQRGCRIEVCENATLELNNCFVNNNCLILCGHSISIGAGTAIGWNTQICDEDYHEVLRANTCNVNEIQDFARGGVKIGKHVLIGNNCFIYKNVEIADGCVVASNSVVKKSLLEPNTLYAGVPAKAICKIENWTN